MTRLPGDMTEMISIMPILCTTCMCISYLQRENCSGTSKNNHDDCQIKVFYSLQATQLFQ